MIALKALGYSMNTTNESEIEEAYQWLIDQRDTMDPIYAGDDVIDNMISGNKALAVVYSGDASYIISENPNLDYFTPEQGTNRWYDAMVITKDCSEVQLAHEFIDFMISDKSALSNTEEVVYTSTVKSSNPATYTGVFDQIRDLFAATADAKAKGYKKGRFSFNVKGGRCEACSGDGIIKIEMHFLPDVYVPCEVCKGKRYNRETLEVKYKDKNIYDVLNMTVEEALTFFENVPSVKRKIQTLYDVGLSYIRLGQSSTELSGGEAQRIKLATELSKRSTGKTIYILDEPTTGLHFADVHKLVEILKRLSEGGNTVVVIEHNLDVIKTADYIIDIGPEGGDKGGTVVAQGTPEEVAQSPVSYTGKYVKKYLK